MQRKHESENGDGKLLSFVAILRLLAWDVSGFEMVSYSLNQIEQSSSLFATKERKSGSAVRGMRIARRLFYFVDSY